MEVMRLFVDPARGFTVTSEEQFSMVRLLPPPAQGGIQILGTSLRRAATAVDVLVLMQRQFQQSKLFHFLEEAQIQFIDRVPDLPVVPQ